MPARIEDIPLDTPIPDREVLYVWSETSEAWITWDQHIDDTVFKRNRAEREHGPQRSFFEEAS